MLRFITFILLMVPMVAAMASDVVHQSDKRFDCEERRPEISDSVFNMIPWGMSLVSHSCVESRSESKPTYRNITVTAPGTLAEVMDPEINDIDSLVVRGPINDSDFYSLWSATFYGKLSVINLENADVENKTVPEKAFWNAKEQVDDEAGKIYLIGLKKIILPDNIRAIGDFAFTYATKLEEINIPQELQKLGNYSFSDCFSLKSTPLKMPEGMTEIPAMCFKDCHSLDEIQLPTTIRQIGEGAFYQAKIKRINFPEGLVSIANGAFYASALEEVSLPSTCLDFLGGFHFALNHKLKKLNIPHGVKAIPNHFVDNDFNLLKLDIPSTIEVIGRDALSDCENLSELSLPEGLREIKSTGLWYCRSLKKLVLPASLTYLGGASCQYLQSLEAIYCSALTPPLCDEDWANKGRYHTFGRISRETSDLSTPNDIPVYVPVGTSSLYKSAYGWDYFTNYIETDEFPTTSVSEIRIDSRGEDNTLYDLSGRKVIQPVPGQIYIRAGKKIMLQP